MKVYMEEHRPAFIVHMAAECSSKVFIKIEIIQHLLKCLSESNRPLRASMTYTDIIDEWKNL